MNTLNFKTMLEMNIIKENVALTTSEEILGVNDLPTKVNIIIDGKMLEIIPALTLKCLFSTVCIIQK